jgi:hypothetical protein
LKNLIILLMGVFMVALIGCSDTVDDVISADSLTADSQTAADVVDDTVVDDTVEVEADVVSVDDDASEAVDESTDDVVSEAAPEEGLPSDPTEDPEGEDSAFFSPVPIP